MRSTCALIILVIALPLPAAAQTDFAGLKAKPGDFLYLTQHSTEVGGTLTEITPLRIVIDGTEFTPQPGLKIERRGDRPWDAAVLGFTIGALGGATFAREACLDEPMWHCVLGSGAWFAGIATLIDWRHTGRTTIFEGTKVGLHAVPASPTEHRVFVTIAF